jgi:hypothetical protein
MANVLFEDRGKNFQVPGLPYEETFNFVRPVILDAVPTIPNLENLLAESDCDTLTNPWSLPVIRGFQAYIPTTFKRVTQNMPPEMLGDYFGIEAGWVPEQERILLQLQTEIEAKAATIDAAIIHGRRELGTVVNKAHLLNRIYNIGRIYGHLQEREDAPFLFGDLTDSTTWDSALSDMKIQFMEYLMEVPQGTRRHAKRTRKVEVSQKELHEKYIYVEWLKEVLGDNLLGVLCYGSATRTDDPAGYNDFDNWVRVRNVRAAHKVLAGTCPSVIDGKVEEFTAGEHVEPNGAKHLGIHIFPESEEYALRHIKFLHDSREFLNHTRVLYGEFPFIKVAQDEVIERGISQAYLKLKTIAGALNWAYSSPEKIRGKPSLFEFIVKNTRFFLQHSLNATEEPRFRDKTELNKLLAERGLHIPQYDDNLGHIRHSLLYAMTSVLTLQREFIDSGRQPQLDFLVDRKRLDWNAPEINNWARYDDAR